VKLTKRLGTLPKRDFFRLRDVFRSVWALNTFATSPQPEKSGEERRGVERRREENGDFQVFILIVEFFVNNYM
jgi:hypothetical protein